MPFFMAVTGIKIPSSSELSDRDIIVSFKEAIATMQGQSFNQSIQKGWKDMG